MQMLNKFWTTLSIADKAQLGIIIAIVAIFSQPS